MTMISYAHLLRCLLVMRLLYVGVMKESSTPSLFNSAAMIQLKTKIAVASSKTTAMMMATVEPTTEMTEMRRKKRNTAELQAADIETRVKTTTKRRKKRKYTTEFQTTNSETTPVPTATTRRRKKKKKYTTEYQTTNCETTPGPTPTTTKRKKRKKNRKSTVFILNLPTTIEASTTTVRPWAAKDLSQHDLYIRQLILNLQVFACHEITVLGKMICTEQRKDFIFFNGCNDLTCLGDGLFSSTSNVCAVASEALPDSLTYCESQLEALNKRIQLSARRNYKSCFSVTKYCAGLKPGETRTYFNGCAQCTCVSTTEGTCKDEKNCDTFFGTTAEYIKKCKLKNASSSSSSSFSSTSSNSSHSFSFARSGSFSFSSSDDKNKQPASLEDNDED